MDKEKLFQSLSKKRDNEKVHHVNERGELEVHTVASLKEKVGYPKRSDPVVPEKIKEKRKRRGLFSRKT